MVMRYTRAGFVRWIKEPRVECVEKRRMLSDELSQPVGRWIWAGDRRESHFARIRCLYVDAATERIVSRFDAAFGNTAADAENLAYRRILRFMLDVPSDASVAEAFEKKMAEHSKQLKEQKKATSNRAIERRLTKEDFLDSCIYERQIDGDARDLRFWVQNKDDPYPLAFSFRTADGGEEKRRLKRIWDDEEGGWSFVGFKETLLALCSGCEELISKTEDAIVAAETRYYDEGSEPRLHLLCFECFEREKHASRPLREVDNVVMAKGSADIKL